MREEAHFGSVLLDPVDLDLSVYECQGEETKVLVERSTQGVDRLGLVCFHFLPCRHLLRLEQSLHRRMRLLGVLLRLLLL